MDCELISGELLLSKKSDKPINIILGILCVLLICLILFYFFIGYAIVSGYSMENTLVDGQSTVIQRRFFDIDRGDIVTIEHPDKDGALLIKRVIAIAGDRILFVRTDDNRYVDMYIAKRGGTRFGLASEPYIKERMLYGDKFINKQGKAVPTSQTVTKEYVESIDLNNPSLQQQETLSHVITVPNGHIFYMGDNRNRSSDSRYYGTCMQSAVTGKIIKIIDPNSAFNGFMKFMFYFFKQDN